MKKQQADYKANLIGERDLSKLTKEELKLSAAAFMSGLAMHYYRVKGYSKRAKRIRQALPNFDFFREICGYFRNFKSPGASN